jgi:hypothetical protein
VDNEKGKKGKLFLSELFMIEYDNNINKSMKYFMTELVMDNGKR